MDKGRTGCESRILAGSVPQGLEGLEDARGPMANSLSFVAGLARSQGKRALGVVGAGWGWMLREEQAERPACRTGPVGQQQRKGLDVYIQSGEGQFGPRQEPGAPGDPFYLDGGKQA